MWQHIPYPMITVPQPTFLHKRLKEVFYFFLSSFFVQQYFSSNLQNSLPHAFQPQKKKKGNK